MGADEKARDRYLREIVYVVFKRKMLILSVFLVVLAGVLAGVLMMPRTYEASAIVMIKRDRGELQVSPSQNSRTGDVNLRVNLDQELKSEAELVKRRSLLGEVVQVIGAQAALSGQLKTAQAGQPGQQSAGPPSMGDRVTAVMRTAFGVVQPALAVPGSIVSSLNTKEPMTQVDQAIFALNNRLKVQAVENSNLIKLTFTASDSRFAGTVLDLLVNNYLEKYPSLRASPGAVEFFETQMNRLALELRQAEDATQQYEIKNQITSLGRQREIYLKTALEKETTLQETRSAMEEMAEKSRVLREQLAQIPEKIRTQEEYRTNPAVDRMKSRMLELEMERNKLLQKYTDRDRRVTDVENEIALLKERFGTEAAWEFAKESYGQNPMRNPLLAELIHNEANLIRSAVKARNLERDMKDFYGRLSHVDQAAYERSRLERRMKVIEDAYLLYVKKFEEARIAAKMDESRIVNIALAEPVQVAPKPGGGLQLGALGAIVGLVAGVGLAFIREYFTDAFTTDDSVRRQLGLPVLSSIPEEDE
jgi:tyrosine-protein kinase Etk/Wzc